MGILGFNSLVNAYVNKGTCKSNIDSLRNTQDNGIYWCHIGEASGTHPVSSGYYTLEVKNCWNNNCIQVAYIFSTSKIYSRMYVNNQWYPWSTYYTEAESTSLYSQYSGVKTLNGPYGCSYYKNGNVVVLTCEFGNKAVPSSGITLGTLPVSFRPSINVFTRNGFDNQYGELTINSCGVVKIYSSSGSFNYGHFSTSFRASTNFQ